MKVGMTVLILVDIGVDVEVILEDGVVVGVYDGNSVVGVAA